MARYKPGGGESKNPQDFINNVKPIGMVYTHNFHCDFNSYAIVYQNTSIFLNNEKCFRLFSATNCQENPKNLANCTKWKQQGFCENFKESMRILCPVTCGFCT